LTTVIFSLLIDSVFAGGFTFLYLRPQYVFPSWLIGNDPTRLFVVKLFCGLGVFFSSQALAGDIFRAFLPEMLTPLVAVIVAAGYTYFLVRVSPLKSSTTNEPAASLATSTSGRPWILLVLISFGTLLTSFLWLLFRPQSFVLWVIPAIALSIAWSFVVRVWKRRPVQ
jgi:hypothetical protein